MKSRNAPIASAVFSSSGVSVVTRGVEAGVELLVGAATALTSGAKSGACCCLVFRSIGIARRTSGSACAMVTAAASAAMIVMVCFFIFGFSLG